MAKSLRSRARNLTSCQSCCTAFEKNDLSRLIMEVQKVLSIMHRRVFLIRGSSLQLGSWCVDPAVAFVANVIDSNELGLLQGRGI